MNASPSAETPETDMYCAGIEKSYGPMPPVTMQFVRHAFNAGLNVGRLDGSSQQTAKIADLETRLRAAEIARDRNAVFAKSWHNAVDTASVILGLPSIGLSAGEFLNAVREIQHDIERHVDVASALQNEMADIVTALGRDPEGDWHGIADDVAKLTASDGRERDAERLDWLEKNVSAIRDIGWLGQKPLRVAIDAALRHAALSIAAPAEEGK